MRKFKQGDKVRCISKVNSDHNVKQYRDAVEIGNIYTALHPLESRTPTKMTLEEVNKVHYERPLYHEDDFVLASGFVNKEELEDDYDRAMSII